MTCSIRLARVGLTLMELMVVLVILGLLATAIVPSASHLLGQRRLHAVEDQLADSWKLARALAFAQNRPVLYRLEQNSKSITIQIRPISLVNRSEPALRSLRLDGWRMEVEEGPMAVETNRWQVVIAPHGLSQSLKLKLTNKDQALRINLPGVIDASQAPARAAGGER